MISKARLKKHFIDVSKISILEVGKSSGSVNANDLQNILAYISKSVQNGREFSVTGITREIFRQTPMISRLFPNTENI